MLKNIIVVASLFVSGFAFADDDGHSDPEVGFSLLQVNDSMLLALEEIKEAEPQLAKEIYAFQGRISGDDAKIRFYSRPAEGDSIKINFLCHKHDGVAECHRQTDD